jgi:hypothetical protein
VDRPDPARQIATQFITLYWQQVRPFQGSRGNSGVVLKQNRGRQAGVINLIEAAHRPDSDA